MKRISLLLIFIISIISLCSCTPVVSSKDSASEEEVTSFFENKVVPFDGKECGIKIKSKYITKYDTSTKSNLVTSVDMFVSLDAEGNYRIEYEAFGKGKEKEYTSNGYAKKTSYKIKEKGIYDGIDNVYVTINSSYTSNNIKVNQNKIKTSIKDELNFYYAIYSLYNMIDEIENSFKYSDNVDRIFYYISNDKIKVVFSDSSNHIEEIYVFKDNELSKYYKTVYNAKGKEVYEFDFTNYKEIKLPKNLDEYRKSE